MSMLTCICGIYGLIMFANRLPINCAHHSDKIFWIHYSGRQRNLADVDVNTLDCYLTFSWPLPMSVSFHEISMNDRYIDEGICVDSSFNLLLLLTIFAFYIIGL